MGLSRQDRAAQSLAEFGGLTSVSITDEIAIRSTLGFLGTLCIKSCSSRITLSSK
jgi:hypothetical protein